MPRSKLSFTYFDNTTKSAKIVRIGRLCVASDVAERWNIYEVSADVIFPYISYFILSFFWNDTRYPIAGSIFTHNDISQTTWCGLTKWLSVRCFYQTVYMSKMPQNPISASKAVSNQIIHLEQLIDEKFSSDYLHKSGVKKLNRGVISSLEFPLSVEIDSSSLRTIRRNMCNIRMVHDRQKNAHWTLKVALSNGDVTSGLVWLLAAEIDTLSLLSSEKCT